MSSTRNKPENRSLQQKLLTRLLPVISVLWVVAIGVAYLTTQEEIEEVQAQQMLDSSRAVAALHGIHLVPQAVSSNEEEPSELDREFLEALFNSNGEVRFISDPGLELPRGRPDGTYVWGDWNIRQSSTADGGKVFAGIHMEEMTEETQKLVLSMGIPLAIALVLSLVVIGAIVRSELRPVRGLAQSLHTRKPGNFDPIGAEGLPAELVPVVSALNGLFERLSAFLDHERRFVDEAAHELRTPLTIIKAQAQAMDMQSLSMENREHLESLLVGVDKATKLSNALLFNAQATHPARNRGAVDPVGLVRASVRNLSLAASEPLKVDVHATTDAAFMADPADVDGILTNLLENSIRHVGPDVQLRIEIGEQDGQGCICIEDSGPGIPPEERTQIFERFQSSSRGKRNGTGLGLSIAGALAARNAGSLHVEDGKNLPGARFVLKLPLFLG